MPTGKYISFIIIAEEQLQSNAILYLELLTVLHSEDNFMIPICNLWFDLFRQCAHFVLKLFRLSLFLCLNVLVTF